jgi:excisionase family DNA binding protein
MDLLNLKEGAERLRISPCTTRRLIKDGKLPCRRIGAKIFFLPKDLEDFIQKSLILSNPHKEAVL